MRSAWGRSAGDRARGLAWLIAAALALVGCTQSGAGYDPARDPVQDLDTAVERAAHEHKHIVLMVGGEWCRWCHALKDFLDGNETVRTAWDAGFVTVKVNVSDENPNEAFLSQYPEFDAVPHLIVLDQQGEFLHSQGTEGFGADDEAFAAEPMLEFVRRWK
jgi:thioredoxin-related protein